ncbi:hypothetical protein CC86DRAFT_374596 [Ophiobolus disseminans]|uniref:Secreted protein n=1 Tax=Ophiobolus disseminans TaxID=1469910 RepID=A0A6A6ZJR1_9PLEO|nr:hypothetical protein CC86DRAFT_374596 [Ophiobolus disseminans]
MHPAWQLLLIAQCLSLAVRCKHPSICQGTTPALPPPNEHQSVYPSARRRKFAQMAHSYDDRQARVLSIVEC